VLKPAPTVLKPPPMADFTRARQVCKGSAARWTRKLYHDLKVEFQLSRPLFVQARLQSVFTHRGRKVAQNAAFLVI